MFRYTLVTLVLSLVVFSQSFLAQQSDCKPFEFGISPTFEAGPNVNSHTTADFNNDGNLDIGVINTGSQRVSILFGDGVGGFGPAQIVGTTTSAVSVTSGDLNSDGWIDLIVGSGPRNEIGILLNTGNGIFGSASIYLPPTPFPNQGEYLQLRTADFNFDGKLDVAAVRFQSNRQLNIFLGGGNGSISWHSSINLTGSDSIIEVGQLNLNSDVIPDLIVSGGSSPRYIAYMFGNKAGAFSLTQTFSVEERATGFSFGDLNGDSIQDFVVAFEDTSTPTQPYLRPWFGNGFSGYFPGDRIETVYFLAPSDVVLKDLDGDGILDIAAPLGGQVLAVINGIGNGTFQDPQYWAVPSGSRGIISDDLNDDGRQDLVTIQKLGQPLNSISVLEQLQDHSFNAPRPVLWGLSQIDAGDFNNDGLLDFASSRKSDFVSISSVEINLNSANGLGIDMGVATPKALTALTIGDFNGDGNKDAATSHSNNDRRLMAYLGNGTGPLTAGIATSLNVPFENVIAGKFNSDNFDDLLAVDSSSRGYVMLSNGDGTFTTAPNFPVTLQGSNVKLLKGDFNEDGKLDLIVSNNTVHLWIGDGNGQLTRSLEPIPNLADVMVSDIDGDDHLDLVGFDTGTNIKAVFGVGNGTFAESFTSTVPTNGTRGNLVSADFNGDGLSDLAFTTTQVSYNNLVIVPSAGRSGPWGTPIYYSIGGFESTPTLKTADYNADGKPDIGYNASTTRGVVYNHSGNSPCGSIDDIQITEGDDNNTQAVYTLSLSGPSTDDVLVNYAVNPGTATASADFQNVSGRLTIPAGQTQASITVPLTGDLIDEFDETFSVRLSGSTNVFLTKSTGFGTIIDNDPEPSISIADLTKAEVNSSQQFVFNIVLSQASGKPISYRFTTSDGTAVAGNDYQNDTNLVSIPIGNLSSNVNVTVFGDNTFEPAEDFFIDLTEAQNVALLDAHAVGTIVNDDPVPTVSFSTQGSVVEGNVGTVNRNIQIQLSNPTYLPVTLNVVSSSGSATAGLDFEAIDTSVAIAPFQLNTSTTIGIIGDRIRESSETFFY